MMSRGKAAPGSKHGIEDIYGGPASRSGKPGVSSLNSGGNRPSMQGSSVVGAGYNSK